MKKYLSLVLISFFSLCVFSQTKPKAGDGSKNSPYQIGNAQELLWFAGKVNGTLEGEEKNVAACAELTDDIDLSEVCGEEIGSWHPIGDKSAPFIGEFEGNKFKISNLYISAKGNYIGLWGFISNNSKISNLTISSGRISVTGENIGAFVGMAENAEITNCVNYASVSSSSYAGGIVGYLKSSDVKYCHNAGNIITEVWGSGGISGCNDGGHVSYCFNDVVVNGQNAVGGVCGSIVNSGVVDHSFSYNSITGVYGRSDGSSANCVDNYYYSSKQSTNSDIHTSVTLNQFASGKICYLLNDSNRNVVFHQILGKDKYPTLDGKDVVDRYGEEYHNVLDIDCEHTEKQTIAPTCKYEGVEYCTKCYKKINIVPAIPHDTIISITQTPTCTKVGYSTAKCSMCGLKHYNCDTVPTIPHDTIISITQTPTCTKVGYGTAKCSMCGLKHFNCDTVPALGHDTIFKHYENTCHTAARTDTMCGRCTSFYKMGVAEEAPTMKHNYVDDICTVCGHPRSEKPELKDGCFLISNARELLWLSEYVYAGNTKVNARLTADIDLSEVCGEKMKKNWLPIGEIDNKSWAFAGEFDGQGHTVSNLYFNNNLIKKDSACYGHSEYDGDDIGLFGGNSGTIKNVKLKGLSITSVRYVGGIAANNYGTITDCSIESSNLKTRDTYIGGICGMSYGKIIRCNSSATIYGAGERTQVGGIVGHSKDTISHCLSFAKLIAENTNKYLYLGGIVGWAEKKVFNCFSASELIALNTNYSYISVADGEGSGYTSYYTALRKNPNWQGGTYIPSEEVYAGKACYLLNSDIKEPVWAQTLGVDKYPHLRSDDPNEKYVYKYYERNCYDSEEVEKFANCSFDSIPVDFAHLVTYPNHINVDDDPEKYDCCGLYTEEYLSQYSDKDFEIKSVEDLLKFRDIVAHGGRKVNAILMVDIDLSGVCSSSKGSWTSIPTYDGVFKGNGHSIENLYINNSEDESLFSRLNGEIRDLRVTGSVRSVNSAGICSSCHGTISGCISEVNVSSYSSYRDGGGLCFNVDGTIKNCLNLGKVSTNGIAYESAGEIKDCIELGSPKTTIYKGVYNYIEKPARYNVTARDGDLYVLEDDTMSPEMMCLKLNSYEIGWGLAEINGVKMAVPAAFASKLIYPSGLATCPYNRTYSEYSDTMMVHTEYRYPEHIDADNDGVYDCCGYHPAFLKTYNDGVYEIRTAEQLKAFADEVNAGRFINASVRLMCDIDLSKVCGEKIGNWTPIYHFNGKFDGQFHKIRGLYINQNGNSSDEWDVDMHDALGLFSGNYGEICRVGIANDCILKTDSLCIGAVCGVNYGSIHQCYNEANVESTYGIAGGIVGHNGIDSWDYVGRLVNNYNVGSITGQDASGIAGISFCSVISNCCNYNTISDTIDKWEYNGISREIECGYQYMTNSFVLSDISRDTFFNSLDYSKVALTIAAASPFASGEVCYALNKDQDSTVWYQTLNVDPYPVLDPTHGKVLYDEEKGVYYNYPDIIYSAVDQKENVKETTSLVTFVVNRQVIVIGVDSFRIFNMLGHDVTASNGSLADGVYVVVADGNVAKVIVK